MSVRLEGSNSVDKRSKTTMDDAFHGWDDMVREELKVKRIREEKGLEIQEK